jgi:AcrR family transcriptional regulator
MAARRAAIMDSARELLAAKGLTDISLRELSQCVGLAKSNVLRYFDSREAIFLELLDEECLAWLAELETLLGKPQPPKPDYRNEIRVAGTIADSLAGRPMLCELIGAMAGVLERNISTDFARDFKTRAMQNLDTLAQLSTRQLPWLAPASAAMFAEAALTLAGGLYAFSTPTESVRVAMAELGMADPQQRFSDGLHEGLESLLIGAVVRSGR